MAEQWARAEQIAKLFNLSVRRIQQLTQEGIIHSEKVSGQKGRMYDLVPTIQKYVEYLQNKANGKARSDKELDLKEQKLKAEIALKESQGEQVKNGNCNRQIHITGRGEFGLSEIFRYS